MPKILRKNFRHHEKCIVTAGPTYEELDEVLKMTNFSTGALGTGLADYLAGLGHEVELLTGYYSTCQPGRPGRSAGKPSPPRRICAAAWPRWPRPPSARSFTWRR